MANTDTYQYTFNDAFTSAEGDSFGRFSGTFQIDYSTSTANCTITVNTSDGADSFVLSNVAVEDNGPGKYAVEFTHATATTPGSSIDFSFTSMTPTYFDSLVYQPPDYNGGNAYGAYKPLVTAMDVTVCFVAGTRIRTAANGDVAVEALDVGDAILTASGATRPIRWIGHRTIACDRHPVPQQVWPICIAAHAFGHDKPSRDLFVSPGHSICVDVGGEVLIPAASLCNGTTIAQVKVDTVTYWHVELDSHDVILAEELPAESYLEMGNRTFFAETETVALHASPDARVVTHADFCRPFVAGGPLLEAVSARLQERATKLQLISSRSRRRAKKC